LVPPSFRRQMIIHGLYKWIASPKAFSLSSPRIAATFTALSASAWRSHSKAASVGVRNLSLAVAGFAFNGIDFVARLYRLHHHGEARSVASNARMLFDFWRHVEPFRQAQLAAPFNRQWAGAPALTTIAQSPSFDRI
jgi:hypothetical protein